MQKQLEIEKTKPTFIILTYQYNKVWAYFFFIIICNLLIFKISQSGKSVDEKKKILGQTWLY